MSNNNNNNNNDNGNDKKNSDNSNNQPLQWVHYQGPNFRSEVGARNAPYFPPDPQPQQPSQTATPSSFSAPRHRRYAPIPGSGSFRLTGYTNTPNHAATKQQMQQIQLSNPPQTQTTEGANTARNQMQNNRAPRRRPRPANTTTNTITITPATNQPEIIDLTQDTPPPPAPLPAPRRNYAGMDITLGDLPNPQTTSTAPRAPPPRPNFQRVEYWDPSASTPTLLTAAQLRDRVRQVQSQQEAEKSRQGGARRG